MSDLKRREQDILGATIQDYIQTAIPVASSRVKSLYGFNVSPATIRNTMALLEHYGYLMHPHTSAGKIPTDKGYRMYVDEIMPVERLSIPDSAEIVSLIEQVTADVERHLQLLASIIATITGGIGVACVSASLNSRLEGVQLVSMSGERMLLVMELSGGTIRTVVAEMGSQLGETERILIEEILLNRLCGLTLSEILSTVDIRLRGTLAADFGITSIILDNADRLTDGESHGDVSLHGLEQLISNPEFKDPDKVTALAALMENHDRLKMIIQADNISAEPDVTIGSEHGLPQLQEFATFSCGFLHGGVTGRIALLASKRVNYPRAIETLRYVGALISNPHKI